MNDAYSWKGRAEQMLRHGESHKIQVILLAPFFEDANRFRQIIVAIMRSLSNQGIGTSLPDLPGTGESLVDTADVAFDDWRGALSAACEPLWTVGQPRLVASFRGAALIDDAADPEHLWRFAPETGQRLVRDLRRTQLTGSGDDLPNGYEKVAGNVVQSAFLDALSTCVPAPASSVRTIRLANDAADADAKVPGAAIWRRSEPGDDPALRAALTEDIARWARSCAEA
jgi:hypothetical protein